MIYVLSYEEMQKVTADEKWLVTRTTAGKKIEPASHIRHIKALAPSQELFNKYLDWRAKKEWSSRKFEKEYKPQFLEELLASPVAKNNLNYLYVVGKTKDIVIACFCKDSSTCHRTLIKELLESKGCTWITDKAPEGPKPLLVVGSRTYENYKELEKVLDQELEKTSTPVQIVSGGAKGADSLAKRYASEHQLPYLEYQPDWNKEGKKAGYLRNLQMVEYVSSKPSCKVIAFWDGNSKGTKITLELAETRNLPIKVIRF